jgi:Ca-activated chloride channel family protein
LTPETTTVTLSVTGFGGTVSTALPMDVVFGIDSSGSMSWNDPSNLRLGAAKAFVDKMDDTRDTGGVVSWDSSIDFTYGLSSDFGTLKNQIDLVDAWGGTNLNVGLNACIAMLDLNPRTDASAEAIVFLSNGAGSYTPSGFPGSPADDAAFKGYVIYSIGLGSSPAVAALVDMANATGGAYYDAPTPDNLQAIFDEIFLEVVSSTAPSEVDVVEVTQAYIVAEGSFSIAPDSVVEVAGKTVITWNNVAQYVGDNNNRLSAEEIFEVTFTAGSSLAGEDLPVDVVGEAVVNYLDPAGAAQSVDIPQATITVTDKIFVDIDIKPGSDPNSINCQNLNEVIAVAILTTDEFDVSEVDHTTVTFEGATPKDINKKTGETRRKEEDVDFDGDIDLVFHFHNGETNLTCASTEGTLVGFTYDGTPIEGTDAVRMVNVD